MPVPPVPGPPQDPFGRPDPRQDDAVRRREQGRRRVQGATRWALAAAVSGTAVLGAAYAHAIPGVSTQSPTTAPSGGSHSGTTPGFQPAQPPATATQPPHTTSGAS